VSRNWGTKWGCYDFAQVKLGRRKLTYKFKTAWSPFGKDVLAAMSKKFPGLEFMLKFAECRMAFAGEFRASGGKAFYARDDKNPWDADTRWCWRHSW